MPDKSSYVFQNFLGSRHDGGNLPGNPGQDPTHLLTADGAVGGDAGDAGAVHIAVFIGLLVSVRAQKLSGTSVKGKLVQELSFKKVTRILATLAQCIEAFSSDGKSLEHKRLKLTMHIHIKIVSAFGLGCTDQAENTVECVCIVLAAEITGLFKIHCLAVNGKNSAKSN